MDGTVIVVGKIIFVLLVAIISVAIAVSFRLKETAARKKIFHIVAAVLFTILLVFLISKIVK